MTMAISLTARDLDFIEAIQEGLPLVPEPYAAIAERLEMTEQEVIERLEALLAQGVIKRWGVVVRHRELGYRANAMVVWDIADEQVDNIAARMLDFPFITLCYRRPRRLPVWPYNLFCMIHGRSREIVEAQIKTLVTLLELQDSPYAVLFSRRRFKQCGARLVDSLPRAY